MLVSILSRVVTPTPQVTSVKPSVVPQPTLLSLQQPTSDIFTSGITPTISASPRAGKGKEWEIAIDALDSKQLWALMANHPIGQFSQIIQQEIHDWDSPRLKSQLLTAWIKILEETQRQNQAVSYASSLDLNQPEQRTLSALRQQHLADYQFSFKLSPHPQQANQIVLQSTGSVVKERTIATANDAVFDAYRTMQNNIETTINTVLPTLLKPPNLITDKITP